MSGSSEPPDLHEGGQEDGIEHTHPGQREQGQRVGQQEEAHERPSTGRRPRRRRTGGRWRAAGRRPRPSRISAASEAGRPRGRGRPRGSGTRPPTRPSASGSTEWRTRRRAGRPWCRPRSRSLTAQHRAQDAEQRMATAAPARHPGVHRVVRRRELVSSRTSPRAGTGNRVDVEGQDVHQHARQPLGDRDPPGAEHREAQHHVGRRRRDRRHEGRRLVVLHGAPQPETLDEQGERGGVEHLAARQHERAGRGTATR